MPLLENLRKTKDTALGTFLVALILCVVCSVLVSAAAVALKAKQDTNKELDKKKNVLYAAGYKEEITDSKSVDAIFAERIEEVLIDIATGEPATEEQLAEAGVTDPTKYDQKKAAKDPAIQEPVEPAGALPGISQREPFASVYKIVEEGENKGYIFPVYGKGLWSTLYGFIAVESDRETVRGITFYSHAETPGLGGEVDNQGWKDSWKEKQVYDEEGNVALTVVKGNATSDTQIDGLSGATITSKGVDNLVKYWLGPTAYGQYLDKQKP